MLSAKKQVESAAALGPDLGEAACQVIAVPVRLRRVLHQDHDGCSGGRLHDGETHPTEIFAQALVRSQRFQQFGR